MSGKNKTGGGPGTNQFGIKGHAKIQASIPNVDLMDPYLRSMMEDPDFLNFSYNDEEIEDEYDEDLRAIERAIEIEIDDEDEDLRAIERGIKTEIEDEYDNEEEEGIEDYGDGDEPYIIAETLTEPVITGKEELLIHTIDDHIRQVVQGLFPEATAMEVVDIGRDADGHEHNWVIIEITGADGVPIPASDLGILSADYMSGMWRQRVHASAFHSGETRLEFKDYDESELLNNEQFIDACEEKLQAYSDKAKDMVHEVYPQAAKIEMVPWQRDIYSARDWDYAFEVQRVLDADGNALYTINDNQGTDAHTDDVMMDVGYLWADRAHSLFMLGQDPGSSHNEDNPLVVNF